MDTPTPTLPFVSGGRQERSDGRPRVAQRRLALVIPARECQDGEVPGSVRVFVPSPDPPHNAVWSGVSISDTGARRLLKEGRAMLMRTGKRVRGIRLVFIEGEHVQGVNIRGTSLAKPKRSGATWIPAQLPSWLLREEFYQVLNSCRTRPFQPWTGDEMLTAADRANRQRSRPTNLIEMPKTPGWRETLAKKRAA